jgi:chloride channel 3/4/5
MSPERPHTLSSRLSQLSFRYSARPKTMYDEPLRPADGSEITDSDAKINGIRVWYTSYTSIDWLHDTIKDSLRFSRLRRRRKSLRSRIRLMFDKSLGWFIVTIVGFLSAVVAFLVVRSEQWLFDLKEGYCTTSVWKAKRFCCPHLEPNDFANGVGSKRFGELCSSLDDHGTKLYSQTIPTMGTKRWSISHIQSLP